MNRENQFDKYKIANHSTKKSVVNTYLDSFSIEKVRFQFTEYANAKNGINVYIDFSTLALWASDCANGKLVKDILKAEKPITVHMGGNKNGNNGKPISKILTFGSAGDTIFLNAAEFNGKLGQTGLIIPEGAPLKKVSVAIDVESFRRLMIYTYDFVKAFLSSRVNYLVQQCERDRQSRQ